MKIGLLGTKLGMTQIFDDNGSAIPVTILKVGPCYVTNLKSDTKDNYNAIQIGYQQVDAKKLTKPQLGHLQVNNLPPLKHLKEYKVDATHTFTIAQQLDVSIFELGQIVSVSGVSIGKGFAGTVKRHNFTRGPMTHGSKNHREPGSIGQGSTPAKVHKGKKMAGRLGGHQVTTKNLTVVHLDKDNNVLVLKGCVPGKRGNILSIK
ncbi:ribosomal protein L3 (chloroplast) [Guillardia theta]|uniref:Large ribosomal subunit protein uL3c n=2 Tax=Guillardia theta TaxID=55529 RepID=RK3_GUITH|nr:ribosomal protein L3 [Guillardia theta]O46894.1 RecName: Full=Large ribosomal subunit protein uL3c; AltName: Full=50S ribosomal protein L3, chloroplastic [Guillardia theta]AAC35703.1 ribosomal protein L3 [Guillardia theta]|mmetsp:Transcript_39589/g.124466  ORF Transcript_39589/g.124466 Transcript_39589/m.124466 type:complete len:205 (+) Transcript_39589:21-635(+)